MYLMNKLHKVFNIDEKHNVDISILENLKKTALNI